MCSADSIHVPRSLAGLSATQLLDGYGARAFAPHEVVDALLERVEACERKLGAFVATRFSAAQAEARAATDRYARNATRGPLDGVPIVVKDLLDTSDLVTTYGAPALFAGHRPKRDAVAVARLRQAGAVVLAKTATHQFGWGITTVPEHGAATRNPWNLDRIAGGSSGGNAAAIAAGLAPVAVGTDTAGSVRIPADFCGIVGHRPSAGLVSRSGAMPLAPSLDQVGPMARTPCDAALVLHVLTAQPALACIRTGSVSGLRVGIAPELWPADASAERVGHVNQAAARLVDLGATVREVAVDGARAAYETIGTVILAEGSDVHRLLGLWPGRAAGYDADVRARLEHSPTATWERYSAAQRARERLRDGFAQAFTKVDVLLSPASAIDPIEVAIGGGGAELRRAAIGCNAAQSLAGLPACVLRAGFTAAGMPCGVQLTGRVGADVQVLAASQALHNATPDLQRRWPSLVAH